MVAIGRVGQQEVAVDPGAGRRQLRGQGLARSGRGRGCAAAPRRSGGKGCLGNRRAARPAGRRSGRQLAPRKRRAAEVVYSSAPPSRSSRAARGRRRPWWCCCRSAALPGGAAVDRGEDLAGAESRPVDSGAAGHQVDQRRAAAARHLRRTDRPVVAAIGRAGHLAAAERRHQAGRAAAGEGRQTVDQRTGADREHRCEGSPPSRLRRMPLSPATLPQP